MKSRLADLLVYGIIVASCAGFYFVGKRAGALLRDFVNIGNDARIEVESNEAPPRLPKIHIFLWPIPY